MNRTLPVLGAGVLLGIIVTLAFNQATQRVAPSPDEVVRDIEDVPEMTAAVAEKHRDEQYASLNSIEEILALPTEFARTEALHLLAGRSNFAGVRNLALAASRIADDIEREALLAVLFSRLAELDPQSALQLARDRQFGDLPSLEDTVWRVWGRNDLDDALFAVKTQTRFAQQRGAARSLFKAFGYLGNETTDRIETELGIEPDRQTRARYLYRLADRSPAEAITYINSLEHVRDRQEALSWLAHYLSLGDPSDALQYAGLFEYAPEGDRFSRILEGNILRAEPETAIEEMLSGPVDQQMWGQLHNAVVELASTDLEKVMRYFEQARSDQHRQVLGGAIVTELAQRDPAEALAWARAHDRGRMPSFEMAALQQIAQTDPQLALQEALASSHYRTRSLMVSGILQQAAMSDPASAIAFLDQIEDKQQRLQVSEGLIGAWIQKDADAALEWILGQDEQSSGQLMLRAVNELARTDVDTAIRLLPKLRGEHQAIARLRIAEMLGETRSIGEVQAFISQYQGEPDFDQLQAMVVAAMARNDTMMARQLASQIQDGAARDSAYMRSVMEHAELDPVEALGWLDSISDETRRDQAASQVASAWYRQDPVAATQWIANMPPGPGRDNAIVDLAGRWEDPTPQQAALIESIEDQEMRSRAKVMQVYAVMRTNPIKAQSMLKDDDISAEQRAQIEENIGRTVELGQYIGVR
ncbi:MAG: hypothetical protein P8X98_16900 [Woeseiaceae bacterium]